MKRWLAMDIGCIECNEDSQVVGVFVTKEEAELANGNAEKRHGQHEFTVFEIEVPEDNDAGS